MELFIVDGSYCHNYMEYSQDFREQVCWETCEATGSSNDSHTNLFNSISTVGIASSALCPGSNPGTPGNCECN